eukprot:1176312-Prorocentrum_minimum.AAC.2
MPRTAQTGPGGLTREELAGNLTLGSTCRHGHTGRMCQVGIDPDTHHRAPANIGKFTGKG